ncbi:MAG: ATP-dependent 6-phosphofructokinase [Alphaproteobacteria bacterium]
MTKRIGVLTSGGDCPGLNAILRAITCHAINTYGWQVIGIRKGGAGLIKRPLDTMDLTLDVWQKIPIYSGGTILGGLSKNDPFFFRDTDGEIRDRSECFIEGYNKLNLDALIGIGGDGSFKILRKLSLKGNIPFIAIPKTIDNDVPLTEISIGFLTALDHITEAIDSLRSTAASHGRAIILEVMGRDAGYLALYAGLAGGADVILIPEIPYAISSIVNKINDLRQNGQDFAIVVVSESVKKQDGKAAQVCDLHGNKRYEGISHYFADIIQKETDIETRTTILGHLQRGGIPHTLDRAIACMLGVRAVDLVAEKKFGYMVGWSSHNTIDIPIDDVIANERRISPNHVAVKTARSLGIYVGEE